ASTAALLCGLLLAVEPGIAAARDPASHVDAAKAIAKGLDFLQKDAVRWKAERECSTCHHGTMTVWALTEARRQGYAVDQPFLTEPRAGAKGRLRAPSAPRAPRPGWGMVNPISFYLSLMAQNQPGQATLSQAELRGIAEHTARRLEDDGSALTPATMSPPRPIN